ncbi:MAG: 30S ribosomal protein S6 [Myxococcota bacterium]|nr:30S ribosomal protein S6 [Myxococcota bacterium]
MIREYETVCILDPELEEAGNLQPLLERIESGISKAGGTLLSADHWGKRKLAYEINKNNRGYYVIENFLGDKSTVVTLEKGLRIMDGVWRFLTIQIGDIEDPEARIAEAKLAAETAEAAAVAAKAEAEAKAEAAAKADAAAKAEAAVKAAAKAAAAPVEAAEEAAPVEAAQEEAAEEAVVTEPEPEAEEAVTAAADEEKTDG